MSVHNSNIDLLESRDRFTELLAQHRGQIFRLILCMVHRMEDAEDVFQQAAMTMWEKFETFQSGTSFVAWASQIARYKALDLLSSRGRQKLCLSNEIIQELAQHDESSSGHQEARLKALEACREKLPESDQNLLLQCYAKSKTIRDAAKNIGRSPQSVYVSLMRIRRTLFGCVQRKLAKEVQGYE